MFRYRFLNNFYNSLSNHNESNNYLHELSDELSKNLIIIK